MSVLILGSTGMLGHAVAQAFLEAGVSTVAAARPTSQRVWDAAFKDTPAVFQAVEGLDGASLAAMLKATKPDFVINCIGAIPQQNPRPIDYVRLNALLPWVLAERCGEVGARLIHVTTDCVYDGAKGAYTEKDPFNAQDLYGRSKALGEPDTAMVLRTSIVGPELHHRTSLLEWAKAQKGKVVRGWDHHLWNGVTTKELARCFRVIAQDGMYEPGTFHVHSPETLSKYEMLRLFNERFSLGIQVDKVVEAPVVDKSLATVKPLLGRLGVRSFEEQLRVLG